MRLKDRLLTIALSVVSSVVAVQLLGQPIPPKAHAAAAQPMNELVVDRLTVRRELIVSDTGKAWEDGFEPQQIPRGMVARSPADGPAGIWVRGRLIKCDIDDPFDDRFHAIRRDGSVAIAPGHISWNLWLGDNWRQVAIILGEPLERSEIPDDQWSGGNHPGRLRFQSFRPNHSEPLTDAVIGQGMMSIGGGGFGGGGLPYPSEVLQLWGGTAKESSVPAPAKPRVIKDDGSGRHSYALIAVGPQGSRSDPSPAVTAGGLATLSWDSVRGADAYIILKDNRPIGPVRMEGAVKEWTDTAADR